MRWGLLRGCSGVGFSFLGAFFFGSAGFVAFYTGTSVQSYQRTNTEDPTRNSAASPCFLPTSNF